MKHNWVSSTTTTWCTRCNATGTLANERDQCVVIMTDSAMKFDDNKPAMDLLPPRALVAVAEILTYGAKKYERHNWRKGMKWSRLFSAMLRHLCAFIGGEDYDPESTYPHLAHAACNALMLLEYFLNKEGEDDRFRKN